MKVVNKKVRGVWLSIWLWVMLVVNSLTVLFGLLLLVVSLFSGSYSWIVFVGTSIFSAINVISVLGLFKWKKWAFYLIVITTILVAGFNFYLEMPIKTIVAGLLGGVITTLFVVKNWKLFN
ncbi:MAG: hypothetical protein AABX11_02100 [Nanoarchaeota archaeon]